MAIYSKTPLQLLVDALNAANPQLPYPINTTDFIFGKPVAVTPVGGAIQNTKIKVTPKRSSKYAGSLDLTYRRLDLSTLFRGLTVQVQLYRAAGAFGTKVMVPLINEKYGFNFEEAVDLQNSDTLWNPGAALGSGGSGTSRAFTANANSLMYTGSFNVVWVAGKQELGVDIMTVTDINGRLWPNNNDFSVDRTRTPEFLFSDIDATEIATYLEAYTKNLWVAIGTGATDLEKPLADFLAANSPYPVTTGTGTTTNYAIGGGNAQRYALDISTITPAMVASFPFLANPKPGFNRVLILRGLAWTNGAVAGAFTPLYYNV